MSTGAPPALGNPRRLLRVLESVAGGVRRPASIARLLDVELRVVRAYLAHAAWIGLLKDGPDPLLTVDGLAWVYAGSRRAQFLAGVVSAHPVLGARPEAAAIAELLLAAGTSSSPAMAKRDARAILRLCEPGRRGRARASAPEQLALSFGGTVQPRRLPADPDAGDASLDVYAVLLRALLEAGELRLPQLRALLDESGVPDAGLGGYAALAVRRGDAERKGDVLVVTPGAVARADLADSVVSVALSDPDFRRFVGGEPGAPGEAGRCARWARRLFGGEAPEPALRRLLFGRSLATVPVAGAAGGSAPALPGPFLDALAQGPLSVAFPASLGDLSGGIAWVHQHWRRVVQSQGAVRVPGPLDAHVVVHAGLLSPGEPPPRNIPDLLTLRMRALRSVPAFALLVAAGLLHRRRVIRLREKGEGLVVDCRGSMDRPWESVVGRLARSRGWMVCPAGAPSRWRAHAETAASLGLCVRLPGALWTVDESLFWRLGCDPEHHEIHDRMLPLADLLEAACDPQ